MKQNLGPEQIVAIRKCDSSGVHDTMRSADWTMHGVINAEIAGALHSMGWVWDETELVRWIKRDGRETTALFGSAPWLADLETAKKRVTQLAGRVGDMTLGGELNEAVIAELQLDGWSWYEPEGGLLIWAREGDTHVDYQGDPAWETAVVKATTAVEMMSEIMDSTLEPMERRFRLATGGDNDELDRLDIICQLFKEMDTQEQDAVKAYLAIRYSW